MQYGPARTVEQSAIADPRERAGGAGRAGVGAIRGAAVAWPAARGTEMSRQLGRRSGDDDARSARGARWTLTPARPAADATTSSPSTRRVDDHRPRPPGTERRDRAPLVAGLGLRLLLVGERQAVRPEVRRAASASRTDARPDEHEQVVVGARAARGSSAAGSRPGCPGTRRSPRRRGRSRSARPVNGMPAASSASIAGVRGSSVIGRSVARRRARPVLPARQPVHTRPSPVRLRCPT